MIFSIQRDIFLNHIQKVQSIVEARNMIADLTNVRIKAEDNQLEIRATNLDVGIRDTTETTVEESGSILVNAKILYEILKELPEGMVHFKLMENNWLQLKGGSALLRLLGYSDKNFPSFPEFDESKLMKISAETLEILTKKTIFAVSLEESRPVLNGVLLEITPEFIRMVATDGHRMAFIEAQNQEKLPETKVIIPRKGVHEFQRMTSSGSENFYFGLSNNHIVFKLENEITITRLLDGQFPNYSMVIPKETQHKIKIDKQSFLNSLKRAALFVDIKTRGVRLSISTNYMQIEASSPERGEMKDEILLEYTDTPFIISFNVNYLLDLLRVMDSEEIIMQLNDPAGPVMFEPFNQGDHYRYLSIVMPMVV